MPYATLQPCNPAPAAMFAQIGYEQHEALEKLANIFDKIADPEPVHDFVQDEPKSAQPSNMPSPDPMRAPEPALSPRCVVAPGPASSPRVPVPSLRVPVPSLRVTTLLASPNAHRRIIRTHGGLHQSLIYTNKGNRLHDLQPDPNHRDQCSLYNEI
jgi:hypothetical protein